MKNRPPYFTFNLIPYTSWIGIWG